MIDLTREASPGNGTVRFTTIGATIPDCVAAANTVGDQIFGGGKWAGMLDSARTTTTLLNELLSVQADFIAWSMS